jgi:hypothetical protein
MRNNAVRQKRSMKATFGEGPAGTGFQIFLERSGRFRLPKSKIRDDLPWNEFGGVRGMAAVMIKKALF